MSLLSVRVVILWLRIWLRSQMQAKPYKNKPDKDAYDKQHHHMVHNDFHGL